MRPPRSRSAPSRRTGTGGLSRRQGRANPPFRVTYLDIYGVVSLLNAHSGTAPTICSTTLRPATGDVDATILHDEVLPLLLNAMVSLVLLGNNSSAC